AGAGARCRRQSAGRPSAGITRRTRGLVGDPQVTGGGRGCEDRIRAAKDTGLRYLPCTVHPEPDLVRAGRDGCELTAWMQMLALAAPAPRRGPQTAAAPAVRHRGAPRLRWPPCRLRFATTWPRAPSSPGQ